MSIYSISGKNEFRANEAYHRILKENRVSKDKIVTFDGSVQKTFNIDSVLVECNLFSLFDNDPKAVIVQDPYFFKASEKSSDKTKKDANKEHLIKALEAYFLEPNSNTTLIFYMRGNDLDTRKKETKLLDKYHVEKIICNEIKPWEFPQHIKELLQKNKFDLDNAAFKELEERVGTNEFLLHNAIEKMKLYGETKYSVSLIQELIPEDVNLDIWKLGNALIAKDLQNCIKQKDLLLSKGKTAMEIIPLLSSQIRRAYNVALLYDRGYSNEHIATRLRMKESAVNINLRTLSHRSSESLLKILVELANMDQGIKQGYLDPKEQLDQLLLKYGV